MNRPKVLVLSAAYNGAQWIDAQLISILNQLHVDLDILVSDDGSTDGTLDRIAAFAADPRVILVESEGPSGSAAQNFLRLIRSAPADDYAFVALADQDDVWNEAKLSRACAMLVSRQADAYSCAVTATWADGRRATVSAEPRQTRSDFLFESAGQGCTYVLSAGFYRRLRGFLMENPDATASISYHDWAIYALSRVWRLSWCFDATPMMEYRQHGNNDIGARGSRGGVRRRVALIRNGWYLRQITAIAELCRLAAPTDPEIASWCTLLRQTHGVLRRCRITVFCLRGGRRRFLDKAVLVGAALGGYL
jgi:rhamnosyltransferase